MISHYCIMLFLLLLLPHGFADQISFYISLDGDDTWSGQFPEPQEHDGPFATIDRAQQAVRELKQNDGLNKPVFIYFRGGDYNLDKKILFLPRDSGTKDAPVTYCAFKDEHVVLSGGQKITGWRLLRDNRWVCDIPAILESGWKFRSLFVNGERRFRARTPNEGFYRVKDPMEERNWDLHHYRYTFEFYPGDLISQWSNVSDIEIVVLHFWSDAHCPIKEIDPNTLTVTLSTPAWRRFTQDHTNEGARYFVDNVYEEMDSPGEWYLDSSQGKLYYLSCPDEDMQTADVVAPRLDQLIIVEGNSMRQEFVEYITLDGLTLSHNDWDLPPGDAGDFQGAITVPGAIQIDGSRHFAITNCTIQHIGTYGIDIGLGCRDILIQKNTIADAGGGGILINGAAAGENELQKTRHISILDNVLKQLGRIYFSAVGIYSMHVSESRYAHNKISDLYYTGISIGREWGYRPNASYQNIVEYNLVENAGQRMLSDMGGIYNLGISPGTVIRNNLVKSIYTFGYGGWGIYTDEGSSALLIENNIVYDTKSAGFHQHFGKNNIVRNNIFADGKIAQIMRSRDEDHLSFEFKRNIVYWHEGELLDKTWRGDTTNFNFQNNLYYRTDDQPIQFMKASIEKWQQSGQDTSSIFADPQFVDPARADYNLESDSPAFAIGFTPIDMTAIGPRSWPEEVEEIYYFSNADSSDQPAMFYHSGSEHAKPLLVGLHTWSSDYRQESSAPYAKWCKLKDWVFIHPNFRGPNNSPQATGSDLVVQDILSAAEYARQQANIDTSRIYLIGVSGGGYTALQVAGKAPDLWAAVSAWVPITDLAQWYSESFVHQNAYADMLLSACGGGPGESEAIDAEYYNRSPRYFLQRARHIPIDINAGIYDGHTGSVPVSHALRAFNELAEEDDKISDTQIDFFVDNMTVPPALARDIYDPYYGQKNVLFRRVSNRSRLTIFDGGHEIIPNAALHWLEKQQKP
ncbi:right-handed parallel beta-helix repeat-containing protein [candidate division KSB1 bacterium]|nr:right-handed parallel beta-helix repeat-containing protein [candidate division KSB1 bacterium]